MLIEISQFSGIFIHDLTMQHLWKESTRCVLCQHTVHLKSRFLNVWISVCLTESHILTSILQTFDFVGLPDLLGSNLFVSYSTARSSLRAVQPAHTHTSSLLLGSSGLLGWTSTVSFFVISFPVFLISSLRLPLSSSKPQSSSPAGFILH